MAMCAPTVEARAVTLGKVPAQVRFGHTRKVLRLPTLGGPAGCGATVADGEGPADRASFATPAEPLRARCRRNPSNCTAATPRAEGAATRSASAGAAASAAVWSRNRAE